MSKPTSFSVCIPNYNYDKYIGQTIASVLSQDYDHLEVCISDNNSTDTSSTVIASYLDARVSYRINPFNVGFAGNLERVSEMATKDYCILLSSDDLMNAGALDFYNRFINKLDGQKFAFCSACDRVDSDGGLIGKDSKRSKVWSESDKDDELSETFGFSIYRVAAAEMLRRCLSSFYGYFNFASACYSRTDYEMVGGYAGGRLMNPDKWFHWKLLGRIDWVYFIDKSFFSYRWHAQNQTAHETKSGALKYFIDEYKNTFEADEALLRKANFTRYALQKSFIKNVILAYAFKNLKGGNRPMAKRIYFFGLATYPELMRSSIIARSIKFLLNLGTFGTFAAAWMKKSQFLKPK